MKPSRRSSWPVPGEGRPAPDAGRYDIELRDLSFTYPNSDAPVLSRVTARMPAGTVTAIVGANGAGKSTLVKLLTRMYDPNEGRIMLNGIPAGRVRSRFA